MKLGLFRNHNFALFVFRESISVFGMIFLNVSLALYILNLTGSAGKFASILALGVIPHVIFGPIAGVIVDRLDKRKLLMVLDSLRGSYLLLLFCYSLFQPLGQELIYVTVLFFATCDLLALPAFSTLLQFIVKKEDLTQANALDNTIVETVRVLAPLLGTLAYSTYGIGVVFLCNGITAFISAAAALFMVLPALPKITKHSSIVGDILAGLQIYKEDVRITSLVLNGVLTHIFMFPFVMIGFPYMIKEVFGGTDLDFGIAESAQTVGSICSILGVTFLEKRFGISKNIGIGIIGLVVAVFPMLLLGSSGFLQLLQANPLAVLLFYSFVSFFLYMMFGTYGVFFRTFYQQTVDTALLGRFLSVMAMIFAVGRFAGFHMYGILFDSADLVISVIVLGIGMVLKLLMHIPFLREEKKRSKGMIGRLEKIGE